MPQNTLISRFAGLVNQKSGLESQIPYKGGVKWIRK